MGACISCVWEEFSVPLKGFIRKRVTNEQDADDILQEVFVKIQNNIEGLMKVKKVHAWIYRITRNAIADYFRKAYNNIEISQLSEELVSTAEEELTANAEIASCLKVMVDSLPEIYKQAILLTEFEGMSQKELSEKMGISISGAKSRVQRARKILKEMLLGCCQLEMDRRGNIIDYKQKHSECKYC